MKKLTPILFVGFLIVSSCMSPDRYAPRPVEKSVIVFSEEQEPLPNNVEIPLFFQEEQDLPKYNKVAHIQVVGDEWFSEEQLLNNLKYEAHKLGANAIVNVEFGEDFFAVEKRRYLVDTLNDNKELLLKRKKRLRQYMRGIAVVMDSSAMPPSNDSIASHLAYVQKERMNRRQAEFKANDHRLLNIGIIGAAAVGAFLFSLIGN